MFSEEVIRSLTELIQYLNSHPKLSPEEASDRYRRYFRNVFDRMVHSGESYGQATGAPGMVMPTGDEAEFRKRLTAIDNDLREQVRIVREGVQHYFGNGEYPAPYYAWRIAVILRAAKQYRLELEFLEAFSAKFFDGNGKRYRDIAERVEKSRAILKRLS